MATRPYESKQELLFIYNPREALPEDHLCYFVDDAVEMLDFSALPDRSHTPGMAEYNPRLKAKVFLYGYLTGTFSSRKLAQACREQIPYLFLTRGQCPDFRTLNEFRRQNLGFLTDAFAQVILIGKRLGMVKLGEVGTDGSKIQAAASRRTLMTKDELLALRERIRKGLEEAVELDQREDGKDTSSDGEGKLPLKLRNPQERLKQIQRALEVLEETGHKAVSLSDPESAMMKEHGVIRPAYNCQATVDIESRFIVAADVSRSPADTYELMSQLEQVERVTGETPEKALADNGYYAAENLVELERKGIEGYIPDQGQALAATLKSRGKEVPPRPFDKSKFTYHPDTDTYTCPFGKTLVVKTRQKKAGYTIYKCSHCRDCPHKPQCVPKAVGRLICRHKDEVSMQRMRERMDSAEGKKLYGKRFARVEPVFAGMKWIAGFRRFRLRGRTGALKEFLLLCIAHNLRQLARYLRNIRQAGADRAGKASAFSVFVDQLGVFIALMLPISPKGSAFLCLPL
jgi:transposase